jgi:hypothetical protein
MVRSTVPMLVVFDFRRPAQAPDLRTPRDATPNLLHDDQPRAFEETAHRLRAKQASLQPLTSTAMARAQLEEQ